MPRFYEAYNIGMLAREICPTAHYHLWDKVLRSGMGEVPHETWRNQAYHRYHDGHDLQVCTCRFCQQDRAKFRELLANHLSSAEQALLEELDRIRPQLAEIIDRGARAAITLWSLRSGLTPEQAGQLADFHPTCLTSRSHLTGSRARFETIISAHLLDTLRFLEVGGGFPSLSSEPGPWKHIQSNPKPNAILFRLDRTNIPPGGSGGTRTESPGQDSVDQNHARNAT